MAIMTAFRTIPTRWLCVFGGIFLQLCYDFTITYTLLSPSLQTDNHYSLLNLSFMSLLKDCVSNFSFFTALLFCAVIEARIDQPNSRVARFGIFAALFVGASILFGGYMFVWADLGKIHKSNKYVYGFFVFLMSHSTGLINTANIILSISNFPNHTGLVVSLMQAYFELSSHIYSELHQVFFDGHLKVFMLIMGGAPLVMTLASPLWMKFKRAPNNQQQTDTWFCRTYVISGILVAIILTGIGILDNIYQFKGQKLWLLITSDILVVVGISGPLLIHVWRVARAGPANQPDVAIAGEDDAAATRQEMTEAADGFVAGFLQNFRTPRLWYFLASILFTLSSSESLVNNIHTFTNSLKMSELEVNNTISLHSVCCFSGSLLFGGLSDLLLRLGVGRGWTLTISPFLMIIANVFCKTGHLTVGVTVGGLAYEGYLGLLPTIASDLFSLKYMSFILPIFEIASASFTFLLSCLVIIQNDAYPKTGCVGAGCFQVSYWANIISSVLGLVFTVILGRVTQNLYKPRNDEAGEIEMAGEIS